MQLTADNAVLNVGNEVGPKTDAEKSVSASAPQKKPIHRFKPGQSGNPNGRPKGSVSPATRLRNQMAVHGEKILSELMRQIDAGQAKPRDLIATLQFLVGPLRGELGGVEIPGMAEAVTYQQKLGALLGAQTSGLVSPDSAKVIMDTLVKAEEAALMRALSEEQQLLKATIIEGKALRV